MQISTGKSWPLGATVQADGVNFSVYSKDATRVNLLLFDTHNAAQPSHVIRLTKRRNRTHAYWHVFVSGIGHGQLYGWSVDGETQPPLQLFDSEKILIDPYARSVMYDETYSRKAAEADGNTLTTSMKSVVIDSNLYDWENDTAPKIPWSETVLYETHVRGYTQSPSAAVRNAGTYAGLAEKLPYLRDLGITTLELLPLLQYDMQDVDWINPETNEDLINFWGYQPIAWFAPHRDYCVDKTDPFAPVNEFRDMVKACHRAGIEVLLDVVFNHTGEGGADGPILSHKGFANDVYYLHYPDGSYANYAGTGNTINANHPVVSRIILDSLRYWVTEMHVDGFRFDLLAAMTRGEDGTPLAKSPLIEAIEADPILSNVKIISEPWDAAGLYQVGGYYGPRWAEENDKFRDNLRRFVNGEPGVSRHLADRLLGSRNVYHQPADTPFRSINYVTAHDGFTLNDLVSYNHKHNLANGEDNRDGSNNNASFNYGVEGPTTDAAIDALRLRQMTNFFALVGISQGIPRLLAGDEFRRTQHGNNNAYCQDNAISWVDWTLHAENYALQQYVKALLQLRARLPQLRQPEFLTPAQVQWHGVTLDAPDWGSRSHTLSCLINVGNGMRPVHIIANAYSEPITFALQPAASHNWARVLDTSRPLTEAILPQALAPIEQAAQCLVAAHSVVLLIG